MVLFPDPQLTTSKLILGSKRHFFGFKHRDRLNQPSVLP